MGRSTCPAVYKTADLARNQTSILSQSNIESTQRRRPQRQGDVASLIEITVTHWRGALRDFLDGGALTLQSPQYSYAHRSRFGDTTLPL